MNKDVIYIEPEDDITDIISKIEKSKEKIVAIVPPKKAGVFRSIVNIKLIAKSGLAADKNVVLITVDPSIIKLAAATKLPVAKNLQTAPVIPKLENIAKEESASVELEEEPEEDNEEEKISDKTNKETPEEDEEEESEEDEDEEEKEEKPAKKEKKPKKEKKAGLIGWIKNHKVLSIIFGVFLIGVIIFLVWAFVFAPAVDITVAIKTEQKNFSETVTFTDNLSDEDAKEGKFYLEQKKYTSEQEVKFEATGQKNQGEKAIGEVVVYAYFREDSDTSRDVAAGTVFTYNGLRYVATNSVSLAWDGDAESCDNKKDPSNLVKYGCQITRAVKIEATNPGEEYNVGASKSGWTTLANVSGVYSEKPITGGTNKMITVVQQSDVLKAKEQIAAAKEEENKKELLKTIDDNYYIIESSFEQNTEVSTPTPGVDEEVKDGVKPTIKSTTTATIYVIDKIKLEEFIKNKAELSDEQEIYDIRDIYIENISGIKNGASTKLKAQYYLGPKITESEVVDKIRGRGLGDAQREIRDIYGVSDVTIDTSYPWVMSIPSDSNKVTVRFTVKDQNGDEIKKEDAEETEESGEETTE